MNTNDRGNGSIIRNASPDLHQYKGNLFCFMSEELYLSSPKFWKDFMTQQQYDSLIPNINQSKEDLIGNWYRNFVFCPRCRQECSKPETKCPSECYCRWFSRAL